MFSNKISGLDLVILILMALIVIVAVTPQT